MVNFCYIVSRGHFCKGGERLEEKAERRNKGGEKT